MDIKRNQDDREVRGSYEYRENRVSQGPEGQPGPEGQQGQPGPEGQPGPQIPQGSQMPPAVQGNLGMQPPRVMQEKRDNRGPEGPQESESKKKSFFRHSKNIGGILVDYFKYSIIDSLIIGVVNFIFMLITGMPHSIIISIVVALTNFIPNLGPVIGAVIGSLILLFSGPVKVIMFIVFTIILQAVDALFIKPKLFGDGYGIPGFIMLIAMVVGGLIFGVPGMILSVPVVAIIQYLYENVFIPHREKKEAADRAGNSNNNNSNNSNNPGPGNM